MFHVEHHPEIVWFALHIARVFHVEHTSNLSLKSLRSLKSLKTLLGDYLPNLTSSTLTSAGETPGIRDA